MTDQERSGRPEDGASADAARGAAPARQPGPIDTGRSPPAEKPADKAEPEKAQTEIAAGDVADDLADFA